MNERLNGWMMKTMDSKEAGKYTRLPSAKPAFLGVARQASNHPRQPTVQVAAPWGAPGHPTTIETPNFRRSLSLQVQVQVGGGCQSNGRFVWSSGVQIVHYAIRFSGPVISLSARRVL